MKFKLLLALSLASAKASASELVQCEIRYVDQAGFSNLSGSYHEVGQFTVQDCAKEASRVKTELAVPVSFEFTHYTQSANIHTPGSGFKLSATFDEGKRSAPKLIYTEF